MSVPKLERLLDLLAALLHTERPLTADDLHERIPGYPDDKDAFKRAFERDKHDLREMGVPVRVEPVPGRMPAEDGYRIPPDEYYLPDPGLDADELAALHLAVSAVRLEGASGTGGLRKLGAPTGGDTPATVATLPAAPHLALVFDAVGSRRRLHFAYSDKERVVDPQRLHHQRGRWYLRGHDLGAGAPRSFRLDRIRGDVVADAAGTAAPHADDGEELQLDGWALGDDEPVVARVRVAAAQAALAVDAVGADVAASWDDDGSVVLDLPVRRLEGFRSFVLGFLDDAEVLGPHSVRDDLIAWLEGTAGEEHG